MSYLHITQKSEIYKEKQKTERERGKQIGEIGIEEKYKEKIEKKKKNEKCLYKIYFGFFRMSYGWN